MSRRERQRAERQKRKQRSTERQAQMTAKSQARNEAARDDLVPLREDERPTVVTVGAVVSALIAVSAIVGYAAGVEVTRVGSDGIEQGEERPPLFSVIAVVALMGTMAWGMWKARYWAVLGFQALLVIVLVAASLGLVQATELAQAIGTALLIGGAGAMFYFMIKAMARIQMPERGPRA